MGPLDGVRVVELAGIGPGPFCGMMLADLGADVIRVERLPAGDAPAAPADPLLRNRRSIALDLRQPQAVEALLRLVEGSDILFEGYRPGVTERLGVGPETCLARNPRLVYGRMTGWGQDGPLAGAAGHDINFIALSGALNLIGQSGGKPVPPLNVVGDFGGGGMLLAFGLLAAYIESRRSGRGQVIDASMVDGIVALLGMSFAQRAAGEFVDRTGENFLSGAAPWYDSYLTSDGKYVAIGAIEPQFFMLLLEKIGLDRERWAPFGYPAIGDTARQAWPELRAALARVFASRTRAEWCDLLEGTDCCFAPVLSLAEAAVHPHNVSRGTFIRVGGVEQNAPAPRFSRTSTSAVQPPRSPGADTMAVLLEAGLSVSEIDRLRPPQHGHQS
jgi:alpha-methylacyl-CoA racemase